MKTTFTLLVIALVILISVGCQKEDLPVTPVATGNVCPSSKTMDNRDIRLSDTVAHKQIQNAVACKACHANKDAVQLIKVLFALLNKSLD